MIDHGVGIFAAVFIIVSVALYGLFTLIGVVWDLIRGRRI